MSSHRARRRYAITAIAVVGMFLASPSAAWGEEVEGNWADTRYSVSSYARYDDATGDYVPANEYSVAGDIPEYFTAPVPITVTVAGPTPVCRMTYGDVTVTSAPYNFTLRPSSRDFDDQRITVYGCADPNESIATIYFETTVPFRVNERYVASKSPRVSVDNWTSTPGTIAVLRDGKEVSQVPLATGKNGTVVSFPTKGLRKTTQFDLRISNTAGVSMTIPVTVAKGWTTMMGARYQPCSTISWSYDDAGRPRGASVASLRRDIRGSLSRLSKLTGLRFVEVQDKTQSRLHFTWERMGRSGPSATGGGQYGGDGGNLGEVTFNSDDDWPLDRYEGFGRSSRGHAERGWLVIHEVMHALGFDHVDDRNSTMYPVNHGQRSFSQGDLEGLRAMYPARCSA